jgi:hypothetical protein
MAKAKGAIDAKATATVAAGDFIVVQEPEISLLHQPQKIKVRILVGFQLYTSIAAKESK